MTLLPGAAFKDLGPDGGPYDETRNVKICWHTTEGGSLAGAEGAYKNYPPHLGYDWRGRDLRQYVRLDRHSYSLRGAESDDEYVIQIEVVGFAGQTHNWPEEAYRNIGADLVAPLRELLGVPDQHLRFYGADEGIVLAVATSPVRLSDAALRAYSGHMGHQHAPAPDTHWDPGRFRIDKAIIYSHGVDMGYADDVLKWMQEERLNKLPAGHRFKNKVVGDMLLDAAGYAALAWDVAARVEVQLAALAGTLSDDETKILAALREDANMSGDPALIAAHLAPLLLEGGLVTKLSDEDVAALADTVNDELDRRAQERASTPVSDPIE